MQCYSHGQKVWLKLVPNPIWIWGRLQHEKHVPLWQHRCRCFNGCSLMLDANPLTATRLLTDLGHRKGSVRRKPPKWNCTKRRDGVICCHNINLLSMGCASIKNACWRPGLPSRHRIWISAGSTDINHGNHFIEPNDTPPPQQSSNGQWFLETDAAYPLTKLEHRTLLGAVPVAMKHGPFQPCKEKSSGKYVRLLGQSQQCTYVSKDDKVMTSHIDVHWHITILQTRE